MRKFTLVMLAAGVGLAAPLAVEAQTTTTTTTTTRDVGSDAWLKIKGAWNQTKGEVKKNWGKLTDDDVTEIEGRRDVLIGKLQTRYGISREEAEKQVGGWEVKYKSN